MRFWLWPWLSSILFIVAACGSTATEVSTVVSTPTPLANSTPTAPIAVEATTETASKGTPPPEAVDWLTVEGKTADNLFYLGNPDAPVTIIDYSDFL
ncbi:MAG: DsbA family protein [Anaerolineae bacterium]|nr:DsbA family protein [Anaerolineae bacterium]